jgi:hypothetical protein
LWLLEIQRIILCKLRKLTGKMYLQWQFVKLVAYVNNSFRRKGPVDRQDRYWEGAPGGLSGRRKVQPVFVDLRGCAEGKSLRGQTCAFDVIHFGL